MSIIRPLALALSLAWLGACCAAAPESSQTNSTGGPRMKWAIAIHGGAGSFASLTDPAEIKAAKDELASALTIGRDLLAKGGTAMEAVEASVRALEDNPRFNAGRGAVFTTEAGHELDASIMDGKTLRCGAVGGVKTVKNPITLARLVMEKTPHILLAGPRADEFAKTMGVAQVDQQYFFTQKRYDELQRALEKRRQQEKANEKEKGGATGVNASSSIDGPTNAPHHANTAHAAPADTYHGTVGAVALDSHGNLAAATSTGGLTAKMPGRLGDSPIIGAGTYAANDTCAVSGTGVGERFIEQAAAFHVAALMRYAGLSAAEAARVLVHEKMKPDTAGVIVVGRDGSIAMPYNTKAMMRAAADSAGRFETHLRED